MHQNAEYGIAAHWQYKEGSRHSDKSYEQRINMLRNMMEWRTDVSDAQEFVDSMRSDVFQDRVYIFTPRGDIIDLPAGSTPIDFVITPYRYRSSPSQFVSMQTVVSGVKTGDQVET
jgi:GTP pyrophosphokinase